MTIEIHSSDSRLNNDVVRQLGSNRYSRMCNDIKIQINSPPTARLPASVWMVNIPVISRCCESKGRICMRLSVMKVANFSIICVSTDTPVVLLVDILEWTFENSSITGHHYNLSIKNMGRQ